jgi:predicted permease
MRRLLDFFRSRQLDRRLEEEFAHHLAMLEDKYLAAGHPPAEARRLARREFGSPALHRDAHRDVRGLPWLTDFFNDLRHAARQLRLSPLFCAIAILTMSLGIGSSTAIFTLVNAALLRESPYPEPARLRDITRTTRERTGWPIFDSNQFLAFRNADTGFAHIAAARDRGRINWIHDGSASELTVLRVSADYFHALGILPQYGRDFTRADEAGTVDTTVIISARLLARLNGRMDSPLNLGGNPHAIIGVLPADFPEREVDLYVPMHPRPVQDGDNIHVFGRLAAATPPARAAEVCSRIFTDLLTREYTNMSADLRISLERYGSVDGREYMAPLLVLSGSVGLILLIACVNLSSLLLARASSRHRELAIRSSLGAGRGRIVRQLLAESVLLSACGGLCGAALAYGLIPLLLAISPIEVDTWVIEMDLTALAFAIGVSTLAGITLGLVPAWSASRINPSSAMRDGSQKGASARSGINLRRGLVVAEIAVSVILLITSAVLVSSLNQLLALPSGVDETRIIAAQMSLRGERYATAAGAARFFDAGIERLSAMPQVAAAAVTLAMPLERGLNCSAIIPQDRANPTRPRFTNWRYTSPNYLEMMRVPLLAGRYFSALDRTGSAPVVILSEAFVNRYLNGKASIGEQIIERCGDKTPRTIVGVVADLKTNSLRDKVPPTLYVPIGQSNDTIVAASHTWFPTSWVIRARGEDANLAAAIESTLRALDPLQPVSSFVTIDKLRATAVGTERFLASLVSAFAILALLLTSAGVYGVLSYVIAERSVESAIRLALGAAPGGLVLSHLRHGMGLSLIGLLLGGAGSWALLRWVQSSAASVLPVGGIAFGILILPIGLLLAVVLLASLIPSLRLLRLDPNQLLRSS